MLKILKIIVYYLKKDRENKQESTFTNEMIMLIELDRNKR